MKVTPGKLSGCYIFEPKVFGDSRGFFMELWNKKTYENLDIHLDFVQDNLSRSVKGVLRGLHFQNPNPQGKLVTVLEGEVFDVAVDLRKNSETFGQWEAYTLSAENKKQFYIPEGFAHGFLVTSDSALFSYKCTDFYSPEAEMSILWNDPGIGIDWPMTDVNLSDKDKKAYALNEVPMSKFEF